jgi:small subunit ribosomal protein S1
VDGLVHLSELSWDHVDHPSDLVKVGQELEVEVISIDEDKRRIGLSMRRLQDNPWIEKAEEIQEGQLIQGTITNLTDFGAFARIENTDLEGLIHISELSIDRVGHPSEVVSVGETLALRVISLDMERHRIGLSLEKVDSDEFAAIDFEQIQEEMNGESSVDDILSDTEAGEAGEDAQSEVSEEEEEEELVDTPPEEDAVEEDDDEGEAVETEEEELVDTPSEEDAVEEDDDDEGEAVETEEEEESPPDEEPAEEEEDSPLPDEE